MSQRRRWLTVSMLTIAAVIAAAATPAPVAAQAPKEVEVALIVPLSGPWARQGSQLASTRGSVGCVAMPASCKR